MTDRHIDYIALDEIVPYADNPKEHADEKIKASIRRFGFTNALLLCERRRELAEGHGRLSALRELQNENPEDVPSGIQTQDGVWLAPVQRGWSSKDDREFESYVVAANQLTILGGWDDTNLADLLQRQDDLTGVGFEPDDVSELLARLEPAEPPTSFPEFGDDIETEYVCPKCNYEWSGKPS